MTLADAREAARLAMDDWGDRPSTPAAAACHALGRMLYHLERIERERAVVIAGSGWVDPGCFGGGC